jgi:mannose-1-phosphate guanylyltransferase
VRSSKDLDKVLRDRFAKLPRISFDYAIMEKADRVLVVEASFDWDDVGSWQAVSRYFKKDEHGNVSNAALTALDSSDNIVFNDGETTVALVGVHNLIVVRTDDAILICDRHDAEKIKHLVGKLPPELQ